VILRRQIVSARAGLEETHQDFGVGGIRLREHGVFEVGGQVRKEKDNTKSNNNKSSQMPSGLQGSGKTNRRQI